MKTQKSNLMLNIMNVTDNIIAPRLSLYIYHYYFNLDQTILDNILLKKRGWGWRHLVKVIKKNSHSLYRHV